MPDNSLEICLTAIDQRPGHFLLTCDTLHYPVRLNVETNVIFTDWVRRLQPVFIGQGDPAGQLAPADLLRTVGTWLWQALFPESAPAQAREALAQALRTERTPLLLTLSEPLAGLPWELLCDPQQVNEQGFLALRRPLLRFHPSTPATTPLAPPLRVLLLISSPPALGEDTRVDVESERAAVEQATRDAREAGLLHLLVEDIVTPRCVQQALIRFKPHIVYDRMHAKRNLSREAHGDVVVASGFTPLPVYRARENASATRRYCCRPQSGSQSGMVQWRSPRSDPTLQLCTPL